MATPEAPHDPTRAKLIEAAGVIFADKGFQAATVREICARAGANVAAVNYHFRDKMGLYLEVLRQSICNDAREDVRKIAAGGTKPEDALGLMIGALLRQIALGGERGAVTVRIMANEMAHPTPALDHVIEEVMGPNYAAMRGVVGRIVGLPIGHETVRMCAHSVIAQVVHYAHAREVIKRLWPELRLTEKRVSAIAEHIAEFSLAGLKAIAKKKRTVA